MTLAVLDQSFFGNSLTAWLLALAAAVLAYSALVGLRYIFVKRLARLAAITKTWVDDAVIDLLARTRKAFLLVVAFAVGSLALNLSGSVQSWIRIAVTIAVVVQAALWTNAFVRFWVRRYAEQRAQTDPGSLTTLNAIGLAVRFVVWVLLLLVALDTFGVNVTAMVAGLGITGIAIALAVQSILGDLFGALTIVLDKPFLVGDSIEVDNIAGTVEHIGLKTTRVRSVNGEQIVISNGDLLKSRIRNYKQMTERRAVILTTLSPDTTPEDLARAPKLIEDLVATMPLVRPERSRLRATTDQGFEVETSYYVESPAYGIFADTRQTVLVAIASTFRREGIALAFRVAAAPAATIPKSLPPQ